MPANPSSKNGFSLMTQGEKCLDGRLEVFPKQFLL
jgi:hypothetical protein